MDNEYQEVVQIDLQYINPPRTKVLQDISDSVLFVEVREKGSELLKYKYVIEREPLRVNLRNVVLTSAGRKSTGYLLTATLIDDLGYQLGMTGSVVSISPDTLFFTFLRESSKKLPVVADFDIETRKQHMVYGKVILSPDSIMVKGPEELISGMNSVALGKITFRDLSENTSIIGHVQFNAEHKSLTAIPNEVSVTIPVEKFTEATLQVPITIVADSGMRLKLFPETVTVNYLVALKDYSQVSPGMFLMVADFRGLDLGAEQKVRIKAHEVPSTIKVNRIEPERVEFIILN